MSNVDGTAHAVKDGTDERMRFGLMRRRVLARVPFLVVKETVKHDRGSCALILLHALITTAACLSYISVTLIC